MRRPSIESVSIEYWLSLLLLGTLFLTNRYLSLPADERWVNFAGGDSFAYLAMAKAFPSLPVDVTMPLHHAQRLALPYLLGGAAWLLGVPAQDVFLPFAVLAVLGVVLAVHAILDGLGLEPDKRMMVLGLVILNAYMFRYYVAIPWMVSDLGFQLGLAALLLGLFRRSAGLTLGGLLAMALAKQTALAAIPGVMGWIWWEWKAPRRARIALCAGVAVLGPAVYGGTAWIGQSFAGPSLVVRHVTGLTSWMLTDFSPTELSLFVARGLIGFVFPAALLLSLAVGRRLPAGWYRNRTFLLCFFLAGSICLQPLLGGPVNTNRSMTRLTMLGYLPVVVGLGSLLAVTSLPASLQRRLVFLTVFAVAISSFHHFYSFLGVLDVGRAARFAVVYLGSALVLFVGSVVVQRLESAGRA